MDISSASAVPADSAGTTRRTAVTLAGVGGLSVALAACGGSGSGSSDSTPASSAPASSAPASPAGSPSQGGGGAATPLAKTSDIPEGGGTVFKAQKVVVTQPEAGEFRCFSAICPHQGCTISTVTDGKIVCPCHGSTFRIADGAVAHGPAVKALAPKTITVSGGEITLD